MGFEPIGPYALTRVDLLAASLVISFRAGSSKTKTTCFLLVIGALIVATCAAYFGDYFMAGMAVFFLVLLFVIGPMLRSLKDSRGIVLTYDPDGVRADTPKANTLYKWSTIERLVRAGPRLFIMINGRCGIVIDERNTTPANMDALIRTVIQHMETRE
jgi:hypothetical protein